MICLHLFFAGIVNEITLHPRPASHSLAGNVETDHPRAEKLATVARCEVIKLPGTDAVGSLSFYAENAPITTTSFRDSDHKNRVTNSPQDVIEYN